jgi:hypothetical protein
LSRPRQYTVLIAAAELLPTLKKRPIDPDSEVLAFADTDALKALDVISKRRPSVIVLEQEFSATPRGAALVRRIQADPSLSESEIRVVSKDSGESSVIEALTAVDDEAEVDTKTGALDQRGTRRATRFKIGGTVEIVVDGNIATLVDLSTIGAQVVSAIVLRPTQRLRVTLADDHTTIRFNATVAWASFEIPRQTSPRYRAGLEFIDAEAPAVDAFRRRHGQG